MKRKIGLIIILSIEIIIGVLYNINSVWDAMSSAMPFLSFIESWISNFVDFIKDLLAIPYFKDFEEPVKDWIVWILLNIVFILNRPFGNFAFRKMLPLSGVFFLYRPYTLTLVSIFVSFIFMQYY